MPVARPALVLLLLLVVGCHADSSSAPPPLPVTTTAAKEAKIPVYIDHVGTTEAVATIEVRARVRGVLEKVLFKEGSDVERDDLLFVIERAPYEAALAKARGDYERSKATAERTLADYERTAALQQRDVISKSELDHARAARDEAAAAVMSAKASVDQAAIDLGYTEIRAPIAGRAGKLLRDRGNLVGGSEETVLTTIVQLDPMYIYWSPSERERLEVLRLRKAGTYVERDQIEVTATLADGSQHPYPGKLNFVDNGIDPNAGTLRVRAVFPNPDKNLLPGQYANLHILVGRDVPVLLVPAAAIIEEQGGSSVFVVKPDSTIEPRAVQAGQVHEQMRVIDSGLTAGERIAVDNLGKLRGGMKVNARESDSAPSSEENPAAQAPAPAADAAARR
ncbi:MAG TPA: efflux RND transporter periplasmic adaptor subunit [Myxococcota bacterium]|nr:efflux RND transporter periplasmic adaptor subunit [Myxococcota bacterium]